MTPEEPDESSKALWVWYSRAKAHEENYNQMLKRIDVITTEYRKFVSAVTASFVCKDFEGWSVESFMAWLKEHAPTAVGGSSPFCGECGSFEEPYFSRIEPMGYFCPNCGTEST